jgi:hypothetical protein
MAAIDGGEGQLWVKTRNTRRPVGRNSTAYCADRRSNRRSTLRYSPYALPSSDDQITGGLGASVVPTLMVQSVKFESLPIQKSWIALTMKVLKSDVRAIKLGAIRTAEDYKSSAFNTR